MKLAIEFVPYILDQRANEIAVFLEKSSGDNDVQKLSLAMLHEVIEVITSYTTPGSEVTWLATMSFRKVKQLLGVDDPYDTHKKMDVRVAREILKEHEKELSEDKASIEERLEKALFLATIANGINTIYSGTEGFVRSLGSDLSNPVVRGLNVGRFIEDVRGKRVAYVVNSLAELVFDSIVVRMLLEELEASEVTLYVKTDTYTNDATYKDLVDNIDIPGEADIMRMETDSAGIDRNLSPKQVLKSLGDADVILSKGLMNYCGFTNLSNSRQDQSKPEKNSKRHHERRHGNGKSIPVYAFFMVRSAPVARRIRAVHNTPYSKRLELELPIS